MNRCTFFISFVLLLSLNITAQDYTVGVNFGPTVTSSKSSTNFSNSGLGFVVGAFLEYSLNDKNRLVFGVDCTSKVIDISVPDHESNTSPPDFFRSKFDQEFLQIPLLFRHYTSEFTKNTRAYFNVGLVPEILLSNSPREWNDDIIREFRSFDLATNFGAGLEGTIGLKARIFVGVVYNVGLINQVEMQNGAFDNISLKNRLAALELGIKF